MDFFLKDSLDGLERNTSERRDLDEAIVRSRRQGRFDTTGNAELVDEKKANGVADGTRNRGTRECRPFRGVLMTGPANSIKRLGIGLYRRFPPFMIVFKF